MGFEHNNNVNHLWWFDVFFCKYNCVPIFFSYHLNLPNAIVRQESRKSKQSVSGGARSWRRVWSSLLSLSFTGNLIPALFLLDWAIHAHVEADVRAWKGLFLQYTIAMCTYVYISEMWKYLELVSDSRITFRALSKVLSSHELFQLYQTVWKTPDKTILQDPKSILAELYFEIR